MQPSPEQWIRIKEIVANALEIPTVQRAAFVQDACGGDPLLMEETQSLLAYQQTVVMPAPVEEELTRGTLLCGRYLVERTLGHGGFATAWLAYDQQLLNRRVVIKLLTSARADSYVRRKFTDELRALSALEHPNIIAPLDSGLTSGGTPFIVTQFAEGSTLGQILDQGLPPLDRTVRILSQVGHTLSFIHAAGILHRDLKPENIIVQTFAGGVDHVWLIDFGIASIDAVGHERSTRIVGSLVYMAPEQLFGTVSTATDIYAFGVIAHEMLTGQVPFLAGTPVELAQLHMKGISVRPAQLKPDLDPEAEELLLKTLHRDPAKRPQDAAQFADRLGQMLGNRVRARKSPLPWLIAAAIALLVAVSATLTLVHRHASPTPSSSAPTSSSAPIKAVMPTTPVVTALTLAVERRVPPSVVLPDAEGKLILKPGDEFRMTLQSPISGHLYLFSETVGSPDLHILFPSPTSKAAGSLLDAARALKIPQVSWFSMGASSESQIEQDVLDVAWSPAPIPDFEAALRFANATHRGVIPEGLARTAIRRRLQDSQPLTPGASAWTLNGTDAPGLLIGRLDIAADKRSSLPVLKPIRSTLSSVR